MSADILKTLTGPVVLVGAGKMGGAMLEGWLGLGLPAERLVVLEPNLAENLAARLGAAGARANPDFADIPAPAVIVLAVKPQVAPVVLATIRSLVAPGTLVVSIMAGRTIDFIQEALPNGAAVVRTIPNTPAAIGQGITVAVPNRHVEAAGRDLAHALLSALGSVEWIADEALMDAATAVSGSGPAYVFLLAEALAAAGAAVGLPADLAGRLARATVAGSGALMIQSGTDAATLRENVTSPGGTTAAALAVLMDPARGFGPLLGEAVAAATQRGRELGH
ncbi:pyrroline-5-carboxylate reductase [Aquabacter spiritensis]|uniref:Pyrroline-5-carboxylate reductase n=1 Tax=Aquabacter spiritensis TaxID=933073 RepID=A0A4R3MA09_9HYPH|nr:pyrroline-5-carboxylate reductase [Aquabacter spiritensis]TCT08225.1 pyrroline-5-carboxylate reductase [Aquabacter spiritensis]